MYDFIAQFNVKLALNAIKHFIGLRMNMKIQRSVFSLYNVNPDISLGFYCVGAIRHVYCVALVRAS